MKKSYAKQRLATLLLVLLVLIGSATGFSLSESTAPAVTNRVEASTNIPKYQGKIYTTLNNNIPNFTRRQKRRTDAFEKYSKLDSLGRCGRAYANICPEIMPTEPRKSISSVHPSGWQKNMGWQRCHLIGFQLAGENANERNLITGTQKFNVSGMLPFENIVSDYVHETENHVLYRVTPRFKGKELVARGVEMEAWSVEDWGDGVCFHVFVFNVAKGKKIDYKTGVVTSTGKQSQKITIKTNRRTLSADALQRSKKTFFLGIRCSSGTFRCTKVSGSNCLSVTSKGKVTVKRNTSPGTYTMKVKITAKGNDLYRKKTVTRRIRVEVTE